MEESSICLKTLLGGVNGDGYINGKGAAVFG